MFGDIYPTKYMGKITATFGMLKFQLPQKQLILYQKLLQEEQAR